MPAGQAQSPGVCRITRRRHTRTMQRVRVPSDVPGLASDPSSLLAWVELAHAQFLTQPYCEPGKVTISVSPAAWHALQAESGEEPNLNGTPIEVTHWDYEKDLWTEEDVVCLYSGTSMQVSVLPDVLLTRRQREVYASLVKDEVDPKRAAELAVLVEE